MTDRKIDLFDELSRLNNELVNTQRELYKKNAILAELDKQKDFFIGMLAHDLRNPLGNVMNASALLSSMLEHRLDDESRELLEMIMESVQTMLAMVNDTLDIAKPESPNLIMELQEQDLVQVIKHCICNNKHICDAKGLQVEFLHPELEEMPMLIDWIRMEQLLNNLITNAVKFSFPDSSILITLERRASEAVISVKDHGKGIPAKELPELFKPYGLASVTSTAGEKQTGLGLTIVERIAKAHHGHVWVQSTVDIGTTFFVALPISGNSE